MTKLIFSVNEANCRISARFGMRCHVLRTQARVKDEKEKRISFYVFRFVRVREKKYDALFFVKNRSENETTTKCNTSRTRTRPNFANIFLFIGSFAINRRTFLMWNGHVMCVSCLCCVCLVFHFFSKNLGPMF